MMVQHSLMMAAWTRSALVTKLNRITTPIAPIMCLRRDFLNLVLSTIAEDRLPKNMGGATVPMVEPFGP